MKSREQILQEKYLHPLSKQEKAWVLDSMQEYADQLSIPIEPPVKPANGGHLIIYQDIKIMPNGFSGLIAPYWRISLTDGSIEMSCDKNNWMPTESRLRIELEQ